MSEEEFDIKLEELQEINKYNTKDVKNFPEKWKDWNGDEGYYEPLNENQLKDMRNFMYYAEKLDDDDVF